MAFKAKELLSVEVLSIKSVVSAVNMDWNWLGMGVRAIQGFIIQVLCNLRQTLVLVLGCSGASMLASNLVYGITVRIRHFVRRPVFHSFPRAQWCQLHMKSMEGILSRFHQVSKTWMGEAFACAAFVVIWHFTCTFKFPYKVALLHAHVDRAAS